GGRQRRGIQGATQAATTARDVALTSMLSAVVVEGRQSGQRCRFLATDVAELGHADDERQRGALADTGNAQHEVETDSEIVVGAQPLGNVKDLRRTSQLQSCNVAVDDAPQGRLVDVLKPGLEACDVLLDLLKEGQISSQIGQSRVRSDLRCIERSS